MFRNLRSASLTRCVHVLVGVLATAFFAFASTHAFAAAVSTGLQSSSLQAFGVATNLATTPLPIIIAGLIRAVLGVLGIVLVCLIVWAGFLYMTAGDDQAKLLKAKNIIKNAIIGLIIALSAFAITSFILSRMQEAFGFGRITSQSAVARHAEPLSGALNGKIIQDHYPDRNALDIPRNTKIMVTFVDPMEPADLIKGYTATNTNVTALNDDFVKIYQTENTETSALASSEVRVSVSEDKRIFVFKSVDLLGNDLKNTNYTVTFKPGLHSALGQVILPPPGYSWTFQVSTKVDLTPPYVVSVVPLAGSEQDRNVTVEMTFSEAMDPTAASGKQDSTTTPKKIFTNIQTKAQAIGGTGTGTVVDGSYDISNGYRTVDFTTNVACAEDLCGNIVYCLPATQSIRVEALAASVDASAPPQARIINGGIDGLADAAGNSLDGNNDTRPQGSGTGPNRSGSDDYTWAFTTTNTIDDRTPFLTDIAPPIREPLVGPDVPVAFTFNMPMKASTLTNTNVQLWPDPYYATWFLGRSINLDANHDVATATSAVVSSRADVLHAPLISTAEGGYDYYPVVTNDVRGNNQFCFFPAIGPASGSSTGTCTGAPYCCDGNPSADECPAPKASVELDKTITLPDTSQ